MNSNSGSQWQLSSSLAASLLISSLVSISSLRPQNSLNPLIAHILALLTALLLTYYFISKRNSRSVSEIPRSRRNSPSILTSLPILTHRLVTIRPNLSSDVDEGNHKKARAATAEVLEEMYKDISGHLSKPLVVCPILFSAAKISSTIAFKALPPPLYFALDQLRIPITITLSILSRRKRSNTDWVSISIITLAAIYASLSIESIFVISNLGKGLISIVGAIILYSLALVSMESIFSIDSKPEQKWEQKSETNYVTFIKIIIITAVGTLITFVQYLMYAESTYSSRVILESFKWRDLVSILGQVGFLIITPLALKYTSSLEYTLSTSLSIIPILVYSSIGHLNIATIWPAFPLLFSTLSTFSTPSNKSSTKTKPFQLFSIFLLFLGIVHSFGRIIRPAEIIDSAPTISIVDLKISNERLVKSAEECHWGLKPWRSTTLAPYGWIAHPEARIGPFISAVTDQFSMDDLLNVRFQEYPKLVAYIDTKAEGYIESKASVKPDFYFLPLLTMYLSNPWFCSNKEFTSNITEQIAGVLDIIAMEESSEFPRFILPLAPIRTAMELNLFTPVVMEDIKDKVILVGIEGAPNKHPEGLKYVIDLPYPTNYHLTRNGTSWKKGIDEDAFHSLERPNLYSAGATHPWNQGVAADLDTFNGFALRKVLAAEFRYHLEITGPNAARIRSSLPKIVFDEIIDSRDGKSDLELFYRGQRSSIFAIQSPGDSPTRRGFYDAILNGCIPVIFREFSYNRLFPSSPEMDPSLFTVFIPENDIINGHGYDLITRLSLISDEEIKRKQLHLKSIARKIQWSIPTTARPLPLEGKDGLETLKHAFSEDAFGMLLKELDVIKRGEWKSRKVFDQRIVKN